MEITILAQGFSQETEKTQGSLTKGTQQENRRVALETLSIYKGYQCSVSQGLVVYVVK